MPTFRQFLRSFSGGEIAPDNTGRVDDVRYQTGLARCRNMIPRTYGPMQRRPGFVHAATAKSGNTGVRLEAFKRSATEAYLVEFGALTANSGYARFFVEGEPVTFDPSAVEKFRSSHGCLIWTSVSAPYTISIVATRGAVPCNASFMSGSTFTNAPGGVPTAHGMSNGDAIGVLINGGGTYPTTTPAMNRALTYYVKNVTANTFELAETPGGTSLTISAVGSGALGWAPVVTDDDTYQFSALSGAIAGFPVSQDVTITRTSPIVFNIKNAEGVYYTSPFAVAEASPYTGTMKRHYLAGELASSLGIYYVAKTAGVLASGAFNAGEWYAQDGDNIYTIQSPFGSDTLDEFTFTQSNDVMSLVHADVGLYELRHYGPTRWVFAAATLAAPLAAPDWDTFSFVVTAGERITLSSATGGLVTNFVTVATGGTPTNVSHNLASGDLVLLIPGSPPYIGTLYVVDLTSVTNPAYTFHLKSLISGAYVGGTFSILPTVTPVTAYTSVDNTYVVTALTATGLESLPSEETVVANVLDARGASNELAWGAVPGAARYRVYRERDGLFGLVAEVEGTTYVDDNTVDPDFGFTPPRAGASPSGAASVGYFDQRRVFAGLTGAPQRVLLTRSGTESDLSYHLPVQDDDRIDFSIASRQAEQVRHIVGLDHMLVFTTETEYRVTPVNSDVLTPTSVSVRPQSYIGASPVRPLAVGRTILFVQDRGGHVFEMGFSVNSDGYQPSDVSARAAHLFDSDPIVSAALMKSPFQVAWFATTSGKLLGLTYTPEEQVAGWHWHDTDGTVESLAVMPEGVEDRLYVCVLRNGTRRIERMDLLGAQTVDTGVFADAAVVYSGTPTKTITGLSHLNGQTVQVLADGAVLNSRTVSGGQLTLPFFASRVVVGLGYTSQAKTLPPVAQADGLAQGVTKNISRAWVDARSSGLFYAGPEGNLVPANGQFNAARGIEARDPELDGVTRVALKGAWAAAAPLLIEQRLPLPLFIVSICMEVEVGG
jgi:hypothetical protein